MFAQTGMAEIRGLVTTGFRLHRGQGLSLGSSACPACGGVAAKSVAANSERHQGLGLSSSAFRLATGIWFVGVLRLVSSGWMLWSAGSCFSKRPPEEFGAFGKREHAVVVEPIRFGILVGWEG